MDTATGKLLEDHINWAKFTGAAGKRMDSIIAHTMLRQKVKNSLMSMKTIRYITIKSVLRKLMIS